jgi:hypothetical protein
VHDPDKIVHLKGMLAIENLSLPKQKQDATALKEHFSSLEKVPIPEFEQQRPQILLGLPHAKWMVTLETICDFNLDSSPIAEKTPLGWTVCYGKAPNTAVMYISGNESRKENDEASDS